STIEMLRSENVQVRSQLSSIQRRMFQEKQQIMDYLRQIENDLIEKEQIKQRELLLRQDYEQLQIINKQDRKEIEHLKNSINHDQQKIEELQEQCSQLLNTIQIQDEEKKQYKLQLDNYQTEIKKHLNDEPIDQLIPIANDQYQSEQLLQTPAEFVSELNNERDKLQQDFDNLTIQYKELDQDYQAWRLYQQNQLLILRDRCKLCNDTDDNLSFDDLLQQIENRFRNLENECDTLANRVIELQATTTPDSEREDKLRQDMKILANQCAQLDEANRAWQQFQQNQLESFRNKLQYSLPIDNNSNSFDEIAQLIVDHIKQLVNERDTLIHNNIQTTEKLHNDFESEPINNINIQRQEYIHSIHEHSPSEDISINNLTSAPMLMNEHDEEIRKLRENLANLTTQCTQLDEANRAWQQYQQTQLQQVHQQLQSHLPLDNLNSFDQLPQLIIDHINTLNQQYQTVQQTNQQLQLESETNLQTIKQAQINTINELNQEVLVLQEQLDNKTNDLEEQQMNDESKQISKGNELEFVALNNEENVDILRKEFEDIVSIDYNVSFEGVVRQIVDEMKRERKELNERYEALEKANNDLQTESGNNMESIRQSYLNTVDELNQELLAMKEQYEQLDAEKQILNDKLENQSVIQPIESSSFNSNVTDETHPIWNEIQSILNLLDELSREKFIFHIHHLISEYRLAKDKINILTKDLENINQQLTNIYNQCEQLQETNKQLLSEKEVFNGKSMNDDQFQQEYILLKNQCTQLDIANRSWQLFYDNQIELLKNKFKNYFDFDQNNNFDQIIDIIAKEFEQLKETIPSEKEQIKQRELLLRQDYEQLQIINKQDRKEIEHLKNSINHDQQKIEELQEQCSQLLNTIQIQDEEKKQYILQLDSYQTEIKKHLNDEPIDQLIPISNDQYQSEQLLQTPAEFVSELNNERDKLQLDFDNLTIQYKELDQDYQAWRLYQQNQLLILRDRCKLCNDTDDNLSFDDLLQQIENRFRNLENECDTLANRVIELQATTTPDSEREDKLRQDMKILANQCAQLDEANRAWQQFQQNQLENFRNKLQYSLPIDNNSNSFDEIAQLIVDHIKQLVNERDTLIHNNIQTTKKLHNDFESEPINNINTQRQEYIHSTHEQSPSQEISINNLTSAPMLMNEHDEEIRKLRENLTNLTTQCTQLDEANRAWQQYQQTQLQQLHEKLQHYLPLDNLNSFDQLPQLIIDHINTLNQQYQTLQQTNQQLQLESETNLQTIKQAQINTINELNQEVLVLQEQLDNKTNDLEEQQMNDESKQVSRGNELEFVPLNNEENVDILRKEFEDIVSVDYNVSFEGVVRQIVDEIKRERKELNERYEALEKANNDLQTESGNNMESIRQSYLNTVNELNQELLAMKEQYDQLDAEKHILNDKLENQSVIQPIESSPFNSNVTDETHPIWNEIQSILNLLDELSREKFIFHIHHLISEYRLAKDKINILTKDLENINQQLTNIYNQCEQLQETNKQLLLEKELVNGKSMNDDQFQQEYILLKNQCTQLDIANRSWQLFYDNQIELLKNKFKNYFDFDQNNNFDQIIDIIAKEFEQLKETIPSDYNAQMYQEKFQEKEDNGSVEIKKSHNVDIQCNLNSEDSNWNNDWNADTTISTQDQTSNEQEIVRLKTIIEEVQNENENLRVLSNCINNQSISINTFTQTETEKENNDWNEDVTIPQISTEDQTSNEQEIIRLKAIIDEIQNENENLRVLSNCINNQSISINTFTQTENEDNNEISSVKDDSSKQIVDNQTQTDDQPQDKLTQVNTKLKRALQTIKDKINRIVIEQPELFPESTDDTIVRLDHLISAVEQQAIQIDLLKTKSDILIPTLSVQEIEQIVEERNQLQNEKLTNNEEIHNLRSQLVERDDQLQELNEKYSEIVSNVEKPNIETVDNETQTDEQQKDKLAQINNKLKRALQNIKEKIQRIVNEKPELFINSSDDTVERLDNLLSAIEILQNERDHALQKIDELQNTNRDQIDNMSSSITTQSNSEDSLSEDYQKQIDQLQKHLSQKDEERSLLRERLNEVEVEFRKTLDDHESTVNKYEFLKQERDVLIEQHTSQTDE
ncbi:unnamed protein product, partial [Adineta steineri]